MFELLKVIDTKLFLFFNGSHTPFMDSFMGAMSDKYVWIPFYILLLFFIWKKVGAKIWMVILSVAILITVSDRISVLFFKNVFQRYRPCHNILLQGKVALINGQCGGLYGFVSSHAANTFAFAVFMMLFFRRKDFAICMYIWASLVSYSRIYAGVHYPLDVIGGMMVGVLLGLIGYKFYFHLNKKYAY